MRAPLAILRRTDAPLPAGLDGETFGSLMLVHGPGLKLSGFTLRGRRQAVLRQASARQARLEALMPLGPVLALPLGPALPAAAFAPFTTELHAWLDRLEGRVQFQVTVSWDRTAARARFAAELDGDDDAALGRFAAGMTEAMDARLASVALDRLGLPVDGPDMLLNRVLLLPAEEEMRLDAVIDAIDGLWPEGLRLRVIGPSPALSFALASLRPLPAGALGQACEALGLPLPTTAAALAALSGQLPQARRQALLHGGDPAQAALLERLCALSLPEGPLPERLCLLEVRREGAAEPVLPSSLPAAPGTPATGAVA